MSISDNHCAGCALAQDHGGVISPMLHVGNPVTGAVESRHLDCLSPDVEAVHRGKHGSRIDAAKRGVRGDALRAVPDDYTEGDHEVAA